MSCSIDGLVCRVVVCLFIVTSSATGLSQSLDDDINKMAKINPGILQRFAPVEIDEERVAANGIRKIQGRHLVLFTDVRDRPEIDELTQIFDLAVPRWCEYFAIEPTRAQPWKIRAFLIQDRERFRQAGLMPDDLPDFLAGYQRGFDIWIYTQPGNYYTRHLLLHEGTHAFMEWFLDGFGSPWYAEGMAELLGLHRWTDGKLSLNYKLKDRSESEYWGRIKIIRREFGNGNLRSLDDVFNIPNTAFRQAEGYAWAWAACEFLSQHAISRQTFADLVRQVRNPPLQFNVLTRDRLSKQRQLLERDWYLFLADIDYGYDVDRSRLISIDSANLRSGAARFKIRADHSWQKTGVVVNPGDRFRVHGGGRFQVGKTTQPWPCEANGITLDYYRQRPLGMLMVGLLDQNAQTIKEQVRGLLDPQAVGRESVITFDKPGTLCFRINESPANMNDNQGVLEVIVEELE